MLRNIIANFVSRFWSFIAVFIFIPFYLKFLGIEQYGLVSFFASLQAILFLLDAGLSATLRREFASGNRDAGLSGNKYKLLRSIEFYYIVVAGGIVLLTLVSAGWIVNEWLNLGDVDRQTAETAVRLMGVAIALQLFNSLYYGGMMGLEKQVEANLFQMVFSVFKNGFVIIILWLVAPDLRLFYLWFIFADLVYLVLFRFRLIRLIGGTGTTSWQLQDLKNFGGVWRYAAGIFAVSVLSAITLQIDKIIMGKLIHISDVGTYSLAFSLSQIPAIIVNAAAIAIFPRLVYYHSLNETGKLRSLFSSASKIFGIAAISISVTMCFYTRDLLILWTRNDYIAENAWFTASLLSISGLFLALQIMPTNLAFARGITKLNTLFGLAALIILVPMLLFFVKRYGITGAAYSWLATMLIVMPIYNSIVYRHLMNKNWIRWIFHDTFLPLIVICLIAFLFYYGGSWFISSPVSRIIYAILTGLITLGTSMFLFVKDLGARIEYIKSEFTANSRGTALGKT